MNTRFFLTAIVICLSFPAAAQFRTVALAYEVPLRGFNVPVTRSSTISFSECENCKTISARLTSQTRFIVNDTDVELKEFRLSIFRMRNLDEEIITVVHHLESDTIKSMSVAL